MVDTRKSGRQKVFSYAIAAAPGLLYPLSRGEPCSKTVLKKSSLLAVGEVARGRNCESPLAHVFLYQPHIPDWVSMLTATITIFCLFPVFQCFQEA